MTDGGSLLQRSPHVVVPRPPVGWDAGLVAAKLSRPEVPPDYVDRPRLHDALDRGIRCPVTVVTGGAGWGKTLLVASWVAARASRSRPVAWLTVDADDEPLVFWTYVLAALRATGTVRPDSPLARLDPAGGLSPDAHRQIQLGLAQLSREVVLVIDDMSEVSSDEVHDQIARLFRHESPLRVVLVTRVEPRMPLHRLRVRGDLAEVGADQLAFTAEEARELLLRQGHPIDRIDHSDLTYLLDRTAGWAAGLRLAAMFLRRPDARAQDFGASDRAVTDYLLGEVAAGQSPQTWQFLLRTSLVPHICGDLADTLTGQTQGQLTLDILERDSGFVTALGPERHWYRYHPLLGEMLQRQIELERPESIRELHERAAGWFAANGRPIDAVRHAIAARNWTLAGTLLTNVALHRLQSSDRRALAAMLAAIPTVELGRTAELQLCAAVLRAVEGRYAEIEPHLAVARSLLEGDIEAADPSTRIALSLFECALFRAPGSPDAVVTAGTSALQTLDQHGSAVRLAREFRAIALNNRGVGLLWLGDLEAATTSLEAGLDACSAVSVELTRVNDLGHLALAAALAGRLREAVEWADQCRSLAEARGWADHQQAATGYLSLALVSIARNDLGEAENLLTRGLDTQRIGPEPLTLSALRIAQASVDTARGRPEDARAQLRSIRTDLAAVEGTTFIHRWLAVTEAETDLALGDSAGLRSRLESVEPDDRSDDQAVLLARARLADGDTEDLGRLLAPVVRQRRDLRLAVQASVVLALRAERLRMDNDAADALRRALADAEPELMLAPFTGPGTARLRGVLERVVLLWPGQSTFARALLDRPVTGAHVLGARTPGATTGATPGASTEQVTEREKTVLRYLATMLSNNEIAEQMYLSPNTVKVHLRHVYRKLDVTNRRAAVRRARELGLLEDDDG